VTEASAGAPGAILILTTAAGLEAEAKRELSCLLPGARVTPLLLKGNLQVSCDLPEEEAIARLSAADTWYLARVIPVQESASVTKDRTCFSAIAAAAAAIGRLAAGDTFLVRCHRRGEHDWHSRDLERAVAAELTGLTRAEGDYEAGVDWLVSVDIYQNRAFIGVNRPDVVLRKTLRRQRKYAPGARPLNRAQWKIKEALSAFNIELPPTARVLDLGSAPGGWAEELARLAAEVVAVDPAELDPRVSQLPNVRHLRCRSEELADRGDLGGPFDLITCDMNLDPSAVADIMCGLARLLRPGAPALMTVKYMTPRRREHDRAARSRLARCFEGIQIKRLPHNAREATAAMRKKGTASPPPNYIP
jgi:tRNA(Ser,Leu) C12 N-acetylase TAN1